MEKLEPLKCHKDFEVEEPRFSLVRAASKRFRSSDQIYFTASRDSSNRLTSNCGQYTPPLLT